MRNILPFFATLVIAGALLSGCASAETKFGRGMSNMAKTFARTGVGFYEVVTAPLPPYDPVFTDYLSPNPVYPDNYQPGMIEDSLFATDNNMGFAGGDVAPYIPGSRFKIFNTP